MRYIEELKGKLCEELEEYGEKGNLTVSDLEKIDLLAHAVKNLGKILAMGDGYSNSGSWHAEGDYGRDYHHGPDVYGGSSNRSRDSMGRYSRGNAKEDIVHKLRKMRDDAPDSRTREALESAIRKMEG